MGYARYVLGVSRDWECQMFKLRLSLLGDCFSHDFFLSCPRLCALCLSFAHLSLLCPELTYHPCLRLDFLKPSSSIYLTATTVELYFFLISSPISMRFGGNKFSLEVNISFRPLIETSDSVQRPVLIRDSSTLLFPVSRRSLHQMASGSRCIRGWLTHSRGPGGMRRGCENRLGFDVHDWRLT